MAALIEIRDVEKRYTTRAGSQVALRPTSLEIAAEEFVSIVGPSGCGKTTLMKIVAGLLPCTRGEVRIDGVPVQEPPDGVGMVFQAPTLLRWRTVLDNVLLPADAQRRPRARYEAAARDLIRLVGLEGFADHYPRELSGGMQQRVAMVRALIHNPAILLMDEPFGALDAMTREQMNLELQRIWLERRKTILFITHSIAEAVFLADRVFVMTPRPGRIIDDVAVELARPRSLDMMTTPEFGAYVKRIRTRFNAQGGLDS